MEHLTDQPGRFLAVFVFGPILLYKGISYRDMFLIVFAILLIIWDAYWILFKAPCATAAAGPSELLRNSSQGT